MIHPPDLHPIWNEGHRRSHAIFDALPQTTPKERRQASVLSLRAYDKYVKKQLGHLFQRLPGKTRYLDYRLTGTEHIFRIDRNRGRKDIRNAWIVTD